MFGAQGEKTELTRSLKQPSASLTGAGKRPCRSPVPPSSEGMLSGWSSRGTGLRLGAAVGMQGDSISGYGEEVNSPRYGHELGTEDEGEGSVQCDFQTKQLSVGAVMGVARSGDDAPCILSGEPGCDPRGKPLRKERRAHLSPQQPRGFSLEHLPVFKSNSSKANTLKIKAIMTISCKSER